MTPPPDVKTAKLDPATRNVLSNLHAFSEMRELSIKCAYGRLILKFRRDRIVDSDFKEGVDWGPYGKSPDELTANVIFNLSSFTKLYKLTSDPNCTGMFTFRFRDGRIISCLPKTRAANPYGFSRPPQILQVLDFLKQSS
jgi:hypothetical protein